MTVSLSPVGGAGAQFFDNNGNPLSGGKLYTYAAGTTTPQPTWTTPGGTILHTNPIILDSAGRPPQEIWLSVAASYKFVLNTSTDVLIATYDNVPGLPQPAIVNDASAISYEQGAVVNAGSFVVGRTYMIASVGDTDFVAIGAAYNSTGQVFVATGAGNGTGTAYNSQTVQYKLREIVSVKDFGAVGDGVTDDRAAFADAALAARGKTLYIPEGQYLINTNGGSIVLEEVCVQGDQVLDGDNLTIDQGSVIRVIGTTNAPFKVRRGTSFTGLGFYYPNQLNSLTPVAYPATLSFDYTNGAVQFVSVSQNVVFNAYRFIDMDDGTNGNLGHIEVTGNYICAINRGIYISRNLEHIRINKNNFTFGFWLAATENGTRGYMRANATAVQVDYGDGVEIIDNLFFGQLNGVLCSATGLCQFMNINANKFDQVLFPVKAIGNGLFDGNITNNTFNAFNSQNTAAQGRSVVIQTAGVGAESVTIVGNNFDSATEEHIYVVGNAPGRFLIINGNNFRSWSAFKTIGAYAAINVNGGSTNAQITGCMFFGANAAPYSGGISGILNTFQITGCWFDLCIYALSVSSNYISTANNRSFNTSGTTSDILSAGSIWQTGNAWDKSSGSSTKPAFLVRKTTSQTFNSATATDVTWDSEVYDKGNNFSGNQFTAPVTGRYRFSFALLQDNTSTVGSRWQILLISPSISTGWSYQTNANFNSVGFSQELQLNAGDAVKLQIQRVDGSGDFVTFNDANSNYFCGSYIE